MALYHEMDILLQVIGEMDAMPESVKKSPGGSGAVGHDG